MRYVAYTDGGSRGNPGNSACGAVIYDPAGKLVDSLGEFLGCQTNNVAEYSGLIMALDWALQHNVQKLLVRADSELMVKQMTGAYQCQSEQLRPLFLKALGKSAKLVDFRIEHVRREYNKEADAMVNQVLDEIEKWHKHSQKTRMN